MKKRSFGSKLGERHGDTHWCSLRMCSTLLVSTFQMYTEPSAAPTAMWWASGLKAARVKSQPTLKPSALRKGTTGGQRFPAGRERLSAAHLACQVSRRDKARLT